MPWMSDAQIVRLYNQADDKGEQLSILSQLNGCKEKTIVRILENNGISTKDVYTPPEPPKVRKSTFIKHRTDEEYDELFRPLYETGISDAAIADKTETSATTVWKWRQKNNLPPNHTSRCAKK